MTETIKINAICVRAIDYHENDNLITLCSLGKGKIFAQVKGSKKSLSKLRFCASPMCFAEYILTVTKSGKYLVTGCNLIDNFYQIREDVEKFYASSVIMEITDKMVREIPNDQIVLDSINALKEICYGKNLPEVELLLFIKKAIENSGYRIPNIECEDCKTTKDLYLDFSTYSFKCLHHKTSSGIKVPEKEQIILTNLVNNNYESLKNADKKELLNSIYLIEKYFSFIADIKIKSFRSFIEIEQNFLNY